MKKIILLCLIVCIPFVFGKQEILAGGDYTVADIVCVGEYYVKVRMTNTNSSEKYNFVNCTETEENFWTCSCSQKNVIFRTNEDVRSEYDMVIQYYVGELQEVIKENESTKRTPEENYNDNLKRIINVNNIVVVEKPPPPPPPPPPPFEISMPALLSIIGGILIVVGLLIGGVVWFLFRDDKKKEDNLPGHNRPRQDTLAEDANCVLRQQR